jgi:hypothetical protein
MSSGVVAHGRMACGLSPPLHCRASYKRAEEVGEVGSEKVPTARPPEQPEQICWQIWKALGILLTRLAKEYEVDTQCGQMSLCVGFYKGTD